jgi:hypothetical protein
MNAFAIKSKLEQATKEVEMSVEEVLAAWKEEAGEKAVKTTVFLKDLGWTHVVYPLAWYPTEEF